MAPSNAAGTSNGHANQMLLQSQQVPREVEERLLIDLATTFAGLIRQPGANSLKLQAAKLIFKKLTLKSESTRKEVLGYPVPLITLIALH